MNNARKKHILLLAVALLILAGCIGLTLFLLFSNYQNVRLFRQAQSNFLRGDRSSLELAEAQLLQVIRTDSDNEAAFIMLGAIAEKKQLYPEQVYYCFKAYRLNPLSAENKAQYIKSLCFARYFDRLENFLAQEFFPDNRQHQLLLYAAGQNGNSNKYRYRLRRRDADNRVGELALLLFIHNHLSDREKLFALENHFKTDDVFVRQEILAAKAGLLLKAGDINNSEKALRVAYELNPFAFAPPLGRFYANFRNFGAALQIFEKYLATYHDQAVAMQTAEIYCLLRQSEKIAALRKQYQADSGSGAMLCSYYFDALTALAASDMKLLKELVVPLRKAIDTPLAAFMFLCADVQGAEPAAVKQSYSALLAHRNYLDLQKRADAMVLDFLKRSFSAEAVKNEAYLALAESSYRRIPDAFTAKTLLLAGRAKGQSYPALMQDAVKRFGKDRGILKLAIEYNLVNDSSAAGKLISAYKELFPESSRDMLRYDIALAIKQKNSDSASKLFMDNFSADIAPAYWSFAASWMREKDLQFLSKDKIYGQFSRALLLLKQGKREQACDILEKSDAGNNYDLLFFAARTLAENGRNQAALQKYAKFPADCPQRRVVLMNMAELFAENGELEKASELSRQAYEMAPDLPETQLCFADKLFRNGKLSVIPDVVKLPANNRYKKRLKSLWISGMQQKIKECDLHHEREKTRELCRRLLSVDSENKTALDCLNKLNKMPQ